MASETRDIFENEDNNEVPGFSGRFSFLLNKLKFPEKNRYTFGAEKFKTTPTTFRNWCLNNKPPRKYKNLIDIVDTLVSSSELSTIETLAWLYTGYPNPFEPSRDDLLVAKTAWLIKELSNEEFEKMEDKDQDEILKGVLNFVRKESAKSDLIEVDINNKKLVTFIRNVINFKTQ